MKKLINYLACLCSTILIMGIFFSLNTVMGDENSIIDTGKLGDNITYTLDSEGTLTVSGSGEMYNYNNGNNESPLCEEDWYKIEKIIIGEGITSIGEYVFWYVPYVEKVELPETLEKIGKGAFKQCYSKLSEIDFPANLTYIGEEAFDSCDRLTALYIPAKVSYIGDRAFDECTRLKKIKVDNGNTTFDSRDNCNAIIRTDDNCLIQACKNTIIPQSVTCFNCYSFDYISIENVIIPDGVTETPDFTDSHIEYLSIPSSVKILHLGELTNIENSSFNKVSLNNVTLDEDFTFVETMFEENGNAIATLEAGHTYNETLTHELTNVGDIAHAGYCGDIYWSITQDGILKLTGEGDFKLESWGIFVQNKDGVEEFISFIDSGSNWMKYSDEIREAYVAVKGVSTLADLFYASDSGIFLSNLKLIDFTGSDLSNVCNCDNMAFLSTNLETVIMKDMNMNSVIDASAMFQRCDNLVNLDTTGTEMYNVTNYIFMFAQCYSIKSLDLSFMNTQYAYDMTCMLTLCDSLENLITPKGTGKLTIELPHDMSDANGKTYTEIPAGMKSSIILYKLKATSISLKTKTTTYTGKAISIGKAKVTGSTGKVTYTYYTDSKCTKKTTSANGAAKKGYAPKYAGTYYVKAAVAADATYAKATSKAVKLVINKAKPTLKVKITSKSYKKATVAKKAQTFALGASVTGKGTLSYTKVSGSKALTINKKTGKITLAKKTKAGTYKIKVKVSAKASTNYKAATKTVTVTVKVK